jgi:hypothetical protein
MLVTACDRPPPVALDTPVTNSLAPDQDPPPQPPSPDSSASNPPPSTAPAAQAPPSPLTCSREQAVEIVRVQPGWQASNDACVVSWRSLEARQHPERAFYLECNGLKAYPDPNREVIPFRSRSATANSASVKPEWALRSLA